MMGYSVHMDVMSCTTTVNAELRHRQQTRSHYLLQHAQRRHLAHLQRRHRGSRWRLQAHRLRPNTPSTPAKSTQRRSTPATKLADQSGPGSQHGVCHCGSWGRFAHNRRVQQTSQLRPFDRSQLKTKFFPERMIRKFVDNIDEIAGQRASVAEEAKEFTEVILGAGHVVLPEARRIPRRLGLYERPAVRAKLLAALDKKREERRQCNTKHTTATWKALRAACKRVREAIDKGIKIPLKEYVAELETLLRHRGMRVLYKHLKRTVGLGGRKLEGQQAIKNGNGNHLRDQGNILRWWERLFSNLLNTKSPALQPFIVEKVQQRRRAPPPPSPPPPGARSQIEESISLEAEPAYAETLQAVRAMTKSSRISTSFSSASGEERKFRRGGKTQRSRCSIRSRTDPTTITSERSHSSPTPANCL